MPSDPLFGAALAVWNAQWQRPSSPAGKIISQTVGELAADVLCLTEGFRYLLPIRGHLLCAGDFYGYAGTQGSRKVLLWSPNPWREVDILGHPDLPPGRYASGITDTPIGPLRVIGVCVPWAGAHVSTGRGDRHPWADHTAYLTALGEIIRAAGPPPLVVIGDFNQMVPSPTAPPSAKAALRAALDGLDLCTARASARLVDHIALGPELTAAEVHAWEPPRRGSRPVSDHLGATAKVTLAAP